jgi:hypothetical protein
MGNKANLNRVLQDALEEIFNPPGGLADDVKALMELAVSETRKECAKIVMDHRGDHILAGMILESKEGE